MQILYPCDPLNPNLVDDAYKTEYQLVQAAGAKCSLFDFDALLCGEFTAKPHLIVGESILYRGWMLKPAEYAKLVGFIEAAGAIPITNAAQYKQCHYLSGWYKQCKGFTAETYFFPYDEHLAENIASLGWDAYFIKDLVKSNYTERGSIAHSPAEAVEIVGLIEQFRGEIEGGIAVRRVEAYHADTEIRCFVLFGQVFSPNGYIPQLVDEIAKIIQAPFYSVDV